MNSVTVILLGALVGLTGQTAVASDEEGLRNAHQNWFNGVLNEDASFLDDFLLPEMTLGFGMTSMPRSDFLKLLSSGELYYDESEHIGASFRVYGNTGVVTGRSNLRYRFKGDEGFERLHYLAVYVLRDSRWKMAAWQSAIGEEQAAALQTGNGEDVARPRIHVGGGD